jgi:ppGpp synthetase/RelA/SpoT-type nucleotidyltranferase/putative lipoic acid-binding regulatory protein
MKESNMVNKTQKREWIREQVEKYKAILPLYEKYTDIIKEILEKAVRKYAPLSVVQARTKSITSFAEKILRKKYKYYNPILQLTDLCGARIITHTLTELKAICEFIETHFIIDQENSLDITQRLKPTEFGYRSVHYIIQFKKGVFPNKEIDVEIPAALFPKKNFPMKCEIQVRTLLEHAWASFSHEISYKSAFILPDKWRRKLAALAATLEEADCSLTVIKEGLQQYATSYDVYMSEEEIRKKIEELEIVLEYAPEDVKLAHRIGKLSIALGDWEKTIEVLSRYNNSDYKPLLRDLGIAMCKLYKPKTTEYQQGQKYLEIASEPQSRDIDAIASLAGTWKGIDEEKVRKLYQQAFEIEPSNPYSLGNYLEYEIAYQKDISIVASIKPIIYTAIQRCRDFIEVGINLPWAFYDIGKFYLLLGNFYNSLSAYAKAVQLSTHDWMIKTSLKSIEKLTIVQDKLPQIEWIQKLLLLGLAAKFRSSEAINEVKKIVSANFKPINKKPIIIIAGGCNASIKHHMQAYRRLLLEVFKDFNGTIISGGTTAGISGIVGDIQKKYPENIQTIGYIPKILSNASIDKRYSEIRRTQGNDFSVLEALQYWIELIVSNIYPPEVKLLGIDGGAITSAEYKVALALGAQVAILEGSTDEGARLLQNEYWNTLKNLVHLPADTMTVKAFIGAKDSEPPNDVREIIAKAIHEEYRHILAKKLSTEKPSLKEWAELSEELKESNREQADHIFEKLRQIGCTVHKVTDRKVALMTFTKEEVEIMAEMEHARWNVERLLAGWRWGEKKDVNKKINPYIISWSKLPEDVKNYDRETVRKIPEFLAKIGLEIRRRSEDKKRGEYNNAFQTE